MHTTWKAWNVFCQQYDICFYKLHIESAKVPALTKHHSEDQFGNSVGILAGRVHGNDALGLASFQVNVIIASALSTSCNILLDRLTNINWSEGSDCSLIPGVDFSIHSDNQTINHRWIEASCQHQHGQQSSAAWPSQERLHRQCRCGWS